jgi:3-oxoacyl-[acyl-carrier-protein] synthase-1
MNVPIAAWTLLAACGSGSRDVRDALRTGRSGLRPNDFEPAPGLSTYLGRVEGVEDFVVPSSLSHFDCRNNRLAMMGLALDGFEACVARAVRRHGAHRVGVFVGTSTSGILATELALCAAPSRNGDVPLSPDFYRYRHSMHSVTELVRGVLGLRGPAMTVSTACSSSAKVFAVAARAISAGVCDAAVVGGADSVAMSTLHGFNALSLLSRAPCRPFDADRDGISIGRSGCFRAPGSLGRQRRRARGLRRELRWIPYVDPGPEGAGAAAAMREALASAHLCADEIGYVNLHGTASRANDAAEDLAVQAVLGDRVPAGRPRASRVTRWAPRASSKPRYASSRSPTASFQARSIAGPSTRRSGRVSFWTRSRLRRRTS